MQCQNQEDEVLIVLKGMKTVKGPQQRKCSVDARRETGFRFSPAPGPGALDSKSEKK